MRSALFRKRATFTSRPPRWKARLLYSLAFIGFLALSGVTWMVYLALQVPETQLEAGIPFPTLANPAEKIAPIPDPKAAATAKPTEVGGKPAYAYFYTTKPNEAEPSTLGNPRLRPRAKAAKRTTAPVKRKKSS